MNTETALILTLVIPLIAALLNVAFRNQDNLRDGSTFIASIILFGVVIALLENHASSPDASVLLLDVMPGLSISLSAEPLGLLFATVASGLWIITHIFGVGYMRGNNEQHHTRFFTSFSLAIFATMGIAFAANMFTLFIFYELLTVSTYPLVAHKQTLDAKKGARTYLGILMGTSIGFLLVAVIWTWHLTGTLDFVQGGILEGKIEGSLVPILLALYVFGIGKAAIMPFHRWLPAAMVAPTPVSALLHAVAVVKAGVFTMLKVGIYIFGIDFLSQTGASQWLIWLASASILIASLIAMTKDNLKARLAYSTVSQLSYITLGMALATSMGALGGGIHIAMHAMGKITLFMCAGAIYVATHKTKVSELTGLGRIMPFTFAAFLIGALSIIGLPPLGGSWSKWLLIVGAADAGQQIAISVLMISSLLNVAYLLPIVGKGFFLANTEPQPISVSTAATPKPKFAEAPLLVVLPPVLTAIGCLILFFYAGDIQDFLRPIVTTGY